MPGCGWCCSGNGFFGSSTGPLVRRGNSWTVAFFAGTLAIGFFFFAELCFFAMENLLLLGRPRQTKCCVPKLSNSRCPQARLRNTELFRDHAFQGQSVLCGVSRLVVVEVKINGAQSLPLLFDPLRPFSELPVRIAARILVCGRPMQAYVSKVGCHVQG